MASSSSHAIKLLFIFSLSLLCFIAKAIVPSTATFKYYNDGEFVDTSAEYRADFRPLPISGSIFQLVFFNTSNNAYMFGIRMGISRSESLRRFVWEANRGNPVRDNATISFGSDGNLVLADVDARVVWQTNTANKGVVGLRLLHNGNLVLYDKSNNYVWQSFDYATDTLRLGQTLRPGGKLNKLVSRASEANNVDGPYSMVLEPTRLALYYKTPNSPKPYLYYSFSPIYNPKDTVEYFTFNTSLDVGTTYDIYFEYRFVNAGPGFEQIFVLARPRYNSTLSFIRLGVDGNLRIYTYDNEVFYMAWDVTFTLFDRQSDFEDECQLPEKCGKFGLCEENQCVGCPTPNGLVAWNRNCAPPTPPRCGSKAFRYYKLEAVDHFMTKYTNGEGPIREDACGSKCSNDCKCLGYFYHKSNSRCWIAYDLKTLKRAPNSTFVGYIKTPNR